MVEVYFLMASLLNDEAALMRVPTFIDYVVPDNIQSLHIMARAGEGGIATHGFCTYLGGEAARNEATFLIGNDACPIPNSSTRYLKPCDILRFICGNNGRNANTDDNLFGGVFWEGAAAPEFCLE